MEKAKDDTRQLGETTEDTDKKLQRAHMAQYRTAMNYRMLAMSATSVVMGFAQLSGASQEQMKVLMALNTILQVTIMLWTALDIVSGGAAMGVGGIRAASMGMRGMGQLLGMGGGGRRYHQGGYGQDQLAMIQSNERVIPSYKVMTNYGGNISIGTMVLSGGTGKDLARDFTEQLESFKQRGATNPEWG
jgi:uncharacterized membrane protein YtjA (UPF0391 family)